jgi:hypothetical protein
VATLAPKHFEHLENKNEILQRIKEGDMMVDEINKDKEKDTRN